MAFRLTSEQNELRDTFASFVQGECSSEYLRKRVDKGPTSDPTLWGKIGDLGIFPLFADREDGAKFQELCFMAEECGRVLFPESLIDNIFAGPYLLSAMISADSMKIAVQELGATAIEEIGTGMSRVAVTAMTGGEASFHVHVGEGDRIPVSGDFRFVAGAGSARYLLIIAVDDKAYLIDLKSSSVTIVAEDALDRTIRSFRITLEKAGGIALDLSGAGSSGHLYSVLKACEISGVCQRAVQMTVEYVKTRKQFDVPVGSFQAVQHRTAEMHLKSEAIRALAGFASWAAQESRDQLALSAVSALSYACENGPWILESAIQLHGGIAFTWEYDLHLYLRRVKSIEALHTPGQPELDKMLQSCV